MTRARATSKYFCPSVCRGSADGAPRIFEEGATNVTRMLLLFSMALLAACGQGLAEWDGGVGRPDAGELPDSGATPVDAGTSTDGGFCSACLSSADCGPTNWCLGFPGHCAVNCNGGKACPQGSTCQSFSIGKAPAVFECVPTVAACGDLSTLPPGLTCTDGWAGYASGFITSNCEACHVGAWTSAALVRSAAESLRYAIDLGGMPRGKTLTLAERRRFFSYLACGTSAPPSSH